MMKTARYWLAAASLATIIFSCKKGNQTETTNDNGKTYTLDVKATSILDVETVTNEMEFIARNVPRNTTQYPNAGSFLACATITRATNPNGQEITITFAPGTVCSDGKTRSGKLVIGYNPTNYDTMIWPDNYKVNNLEIKGNYSVSYPSIQNLNNVNLIVLNGALVKDAQNGVDFSLSKKSTMKVGNTTTDVADDVFEYTDASYMLTAKANNQTTYVKGTGLVAAQVKYGCTNKYMPLSGRVKVEYSATGTSTNPNDPLTGTSYLTFGTGTCGDKPFIEKNL
jgi:hypothetical protein